MSLRKQARAVRVLPTGQFFCEAKLAPAFLPGPRPDGGALAGDEAHGRQPLQGWVDPAVHGAVGGPDGVGVCVFGKGFRLRFSDRRWLSRDIRGRVYVEGSDCWAGGGRWRGWWMRGEELLRHLLGLEGVQAAVVVGAVDVVA